jgi:hypothetical protein
VPPERGLFKLLGLNLFEPDGWVILSDRDAGDVFA